MDKSMQRNPFWDVIKAKTPLYGFKYDIVTGKNHHDVIIHGLVNGVAATLQFPFPRICRSFSAVPNFTSKYVNFLRRYTVEVGFVSPDPRFQQPPERKSTFVQKLNLEQPKKVLTPPKPMLVAIQKDALPVITPPYIPSTYVGDTVRKAPNEPVSDKMVLAMFVLPLEDLSTTVEMFKGIARFKGSKPAPLRILSAEEMGVVPGTFVPLRMEEPTPPEPTAPLMRVDLSSVAPPRRRGPGKKTKAPEKKKVAKKKVLKRSTK